MPHDSSSDALVGLTVSHYHILERLGGGGMGDVFLAEDSRLKRRVALKFLPADLADHRERRQRFLQEARVAAAIEHPNVASVYDIDEVDGRTFIAMEYVPGRTLRGAIGTLSLPDALDVALQVGQGLERIHASGIVHRDLKPENVVLTPGGPAKIVDFGLAKLLGSLSPAAAQQDEGQTESVLTEIGRVLGTVAYMSPEQARGEPVDARSDIFSFGVVLYEIVTGHAPFRRSTPVETLSAILRDVPAPLQKRAVRVPRNLQKLVERALAKDASGRYQSMPELLAELRPIVDVVHGRKAPPPRRRWRVVVSAAALGVALAAGALWWAQRARPRSTPPPTTALVADFDNRTGDSVFEGALEQAMAIGLEGAPFLTTYNRASARQLAAEIDAASSGRLDARVGQLVCRRAGIKVLVSGGIRREGSGYKLEALARDAETSTVIDESSLVVESKAEVLKAAATIASRLSAGVGRVSGSAGRGVEGETFTTVSLEAMSSYAKAQELGLRGRLDEATDQYRKAIALDPELGRAYAGLAVLLANRGEAEEARKYFDMALRRIDRMSPRERFRTRGGYALALRDHRKAAEEFSSLVAEFPSDTAGHANLALAHFYGRDWTKALAEGRVATEMYPGNVAQRNNVALYALYSGDFKAAEDEASAVLQLNPTFEKAMVALALAQLQQDRPELARATYRRLEAASARGASLAALGIADLEIAYNRLSEAETVLRKGLAGDEANGNTGAAALKNAVLASVLLGRGDTAGAVAAAERAAAGSQEAALFLAGRVLAEARRDDKVLAIGKRLAERLQPSPRAYGLLLEGDALLSAGRPRDALAKLDAAMGVDDLWLAHAAKGRAYLALKAFPEAHSEFEACLKRRGEAALAFLDDMPTYRFVPPAHYDLARSLEGLGSSGASAAYARFLSWRGDPKDDDPMARVARSKGANR